MSINVAIVEYDEQVLSGLARLFALSTRFRCSGLYSSTVCALNDFPKSLPDVVLMDINLPGKNGIECLRRIKQARPDQLILVLTHLDDPQIVFDTLSAGATGYLLKNSSSEQILAAIQDVCHGSSPITGSISRGLVNLLQQTGAPGQSYRSLSLREQQVLNFLAKGFRYKEIAGELKISYTTVHTHIRHVYKKLRVNCRTEAVTWYLREHPNWQVHARTRQYQRVELFSETATSRTFARASAY
jgi:DNA-binding NarL/FixJ family response regulator